MNNSKMLAILLTFAMLTSTLVASLAFVTAPAKAQAVGGDWPMYRYDAANTGYNPNSEGPTPLKLKWIYRTGDSIRSSAAIVGGRVYFGSNDRNLYCLDADTGAKIWAFPTGDAVRSSPAVVGGKVYFGSYDYNIYCLDATTGALIWNYPTGYFVPESPNVVDGKVFIASNDNYMYCFDAATGKNSSGSVGPLWRFKTRGSALANYPGTMEPAYENMKAAVALGRVYFTFYDHFVYCLDETTGTLLWESNPGFTSDGTSTFRGAECSPAVDVTNKVVYVGGWDERWAKYDAINGTIIWAKFYNEAIGSAEPDNNIMQNSAVIAYNAVYYIYSSPHMACKVDPATGLVINMGMMGILCRSSLAAGNNGMLYCGNNDRYIYTWDATNMARIQSFDLPQIIEATPSIANGELYIGCADGRFYAFESGQSQVLNELTIDPSRRVLPLGTTLTVTGAIAPYHQNGPEGQTVYITFVKPDGTDVNVTAVSGAAGVYQQTYVPDQEGNWRMRSWWPGNPWWLPGESLYQNFIVTAAVIKPTTSMSLTLSNSTIVTGKSVTVSGTITPPVDGVIVTLTYTKPDGTSVTRTSSSASGGAFSDTYTPDAEGSWSVKASWAGNDNYQGATSSSSSFTVSAAEVAPTGGAAIPIEVIYAIVAIIIIVIVVAVGYWYMKRPKK